MKQHVKIVLSGALGLGLALAFPPTASASGYLKVGDIKGEATDAAHRDQIEILSWSWGETSAARSAESAAAASGLPTGKRQHKPLVITKPVDKSSPQLAEAAAKGRVFPQMVVSVPDEGRSEDYLTYTMTDVLITSYSTSGAADSVPTETFSLNYEEIKLDRTAPKTPTRVTPKAD
jgi:type VI secretion system secreted protein Hcp